MFFKFLLLIWENKNLKNPLLFDINFKRTLEKREFKLPSSMKFWYVHSSFEIYNGLIHGIEAEGSGISVLRTFRLLRILKLVRFLPNLRRQLVVMLRTMDNVAVFFALLMLFIFIFRYITQCYIWTKLCSLECTLVLLLTILFNQKVLCNLVSDRFKNF